MNKDSLGDRMKMNYENRSRIKLIRRMPVILRLDGKAFHTLTRGCERPFDSNLRNIMVRTALHLCKNIQGAKLAYVQSDEISILLTDFEDLNTDAWFDYNIQKMCSVSAAMAANAFNEGWRDFGYYDGRVENLAIFDCRAFNMPKEEVCNYFIWRQKDWQRNSIQMLARSLYSHKELHGKKTADLHDMIHKAGKNWADIKPKWKNGTTVFKTGVVLGASWCGFGDIIFQKDRNVVECYLKTEIDRVRELEEAITQTIGFVESTQSLKSVDGGESLRLLREVME